jgi:predicted dehydrogenase
MHPRVAGEDMVSAVLAYDRLTCHCELSWRTTGYKVFIEGEKGAITCNSDGRVTVATDAGETSERLTAESYPWADLRYGFAHPSIVATNHNLLAALRGEGAAETTGEDNLKTMWLLHLALASAREHQALPVLEATDR